MIEPRPRALDWQSVARSGVHGVKLAILETFAEVGNVALSPSGLAVMPLVAAALGEATTPVPATSYHVQQLVLAGLLEAHGETREAGRTTHYYVASERALLSGGQLALEALRSSVNGPVQPDPGELMHRALGRAQGETPAPWHVMPDAYKMVCRKVGREFLEEAGCKT